MKKKKETMKHSLKFKKLYKPVIGVNVYNGEIIEFPSINEAGRNGYHQSNIWFCANGKQSVHKGHKWFYKHN
ncbi:hypothetical protein [Mammaliicoccus fleurettii]|uniref:hypothetical protein n=1 Tax=Mammaliicoccus fleurettii TaxID=150056 RepID=UPI001AADC76C|nr:hypothetical protein [Mammaliicoccus fleurettii]MBO3062746.1 hypothetical protein [Mammaliicoccus fleurettii]